MKRVFKNPIIMFILGALIFGGVGTIFAYSIISSNVGYTPKDSSWDVDNTEKAINSLYDRLNSIVFKKVCRYIDNTYSSDQNDHYSIGTKYECDPGDNIKRNFYILEVTKEKVDLIMEENITSRTMTWYNAKKYFTDGDGLSIKNSWNNIQSIDLPGAQQVANAIGRNDWKAAENNNTLSVDTKFMKENGAFWTRDCAIGTWYGWFVRYGAIDIGTVSYDQYNSIRPAITVFKTNLY